MSDDDADTKALQRAMHQAAAEAQKSPQWLQTIYQRNRATDQRLRRETPTAIPAQRPAKVG